MFSGLATLFDAGESVAGLLCIQLLGGFRMAGGDRPVSGVDSVRVQSLVAYLVLHAGDPLSRQHLAALFWPDSPDGQARTNLRKLVLELRRALPGVEQYLAIDERMLRWRPDAPFTLDVAEFERALAQASSLPAFEHAVTLYRGDLLPECYDDWIIPQRERLRQAYMDALERLVAALETRRDYNGAIRHARRLLDLDPLQEATYRLLMRLHALTGDRTGAVRVYHACASTLQHELDVVPSPETREAYERLLAADARPAAQPLAAPPLVGRHAEWERLQVAWKTVMAGHPRVALLRGEPGIGKTRLAEDLLEWAGRQGIASRHARCYAAEADLAYAPVTALLRARPLPALTAALKREVARLLPELLEEDPTLQPPGPLAEAWQRQHLFETLGRVLLADQPLMVVVDDLQWCDEESLKFLHYLTRHHPDARLLLAGTLRPEELDAAHPLERMLASWRHAGTLAEIDLPPLDAGATAQLASSVVGTDLGEEAASRVFRDTEGNPLFIVELARAGLVAAEDRVAPLPAQIQEVIRTRLAHLSPAARELAGVASVVGRSFTFRLLAEVTGVEEDALIRHLDELWHRRIIREHGAEAYDFTHDKLREVAYQAMSATRRRWLHRQIARALEILQEANLDDAGGQIATHYEYAGMAERAAPYYMRAADAARRVYAYDVAVNNYHRLLALETGVDRIAVMRRLGDIWQRTGRWTDAEQIYRQALALARQAADPEAQAECQIGLGFILRLRGSYTEAITWLDQARGAFELLGVPRGIGRSVGHLGVVYFELADYAKALACFTQQWQIAQRLGDEAETSNALRDMGLVHWAQGDYAQALDCHERHLRLATQRGERSGVEGMNAVNNLGLVYRAMGEYARALESHQESLSVAREIGNRRGLAVALGNIGIDYEEQGAYVRALDYFTRQLAIAGELGDRRSASHAIWHAGNVYEAVGRYRDALCCFAEQLAIATALDDRRVAAMALGNIARVHAAQGCFTEAEPLYTQSLALLSAMNLPHYVCEMRYRLADLHARQGRFADAHAAATDALRTAAGLKRTAIQFAAESLDVQARLHLGQITRERAEGEFQQLLARYPEPRHQAAVYYELWRLTRVETSRSIAADLYHALSSSMDRIEYRQRYTELTGDALQGLPELPPLPDIVPSMPSDLNGIVERAGERFGNARSGTPTPQ